MFKVKKGYHKVSLKVHPDRVAEEDKEASTVKFQILGKVYCILSDKEKRAVYDETGNGQLSFNGFNQIRKIRISLTNLIRRIHHLNRISKFEVKCEK